jgi:hypothetical protein
VNDRGPFIAGVAPARMERVQAGPFASPEGADAAAAQVRGKLLLTLVVIQKR